MRIFVTLFCLLAAFGAGWCFTIDTSDLKPELVLPIRIFLGGAGIAAFLTIPIIWNNGSRPFHLLYPVFVGAMVVAIVALYTILWPEMVKDWPAVVAFAVLFIPTIWAMNKYILRR